MRALAHPTRLRLLGQLRLGGAATATECAAAVGESPSSCSYHLRTLARWGFVEEAEADDGRERPWRALHRGTRWDAATSASSPEAAAASGLLRDTVLAEDRRRLDDYLAHADEFPDEWREAVLGRSSQLRLTAGELKKLDRQLEKLLRPYFDATRKGAPKNARRVHFAASAVPRRD